MGNSVELTQKRQRRSTADWAPAFLATLAQMANVRAACQAAGIARQTAYDRRAADEDFAALWAEAIEEAVDLLEAEAWRRACGESDRLLESLLRAHRPELYDRARRLELVPKVDVGKLSEPELIELAQTGKLTPRA